MPQITLDSILEKYPFLDEHTAREPYLFQVLNEIVRVQREFEKGKTPQLATRKHISSTSNIKMPITPSRDKNLHYILTHLTERFPDYVSSIITFDFQFNDKTKKLQIEATEEFCYSLAHSEIDKMQRQRDQKSLENFCTLIGRFRTFNLTKLLKLIVQKKDFARVLQSGVNRAFFVYKCSEIAANKILPEQEFCFHAKNYQSVQTSLSMNQLRSVMIVYNDMLKKRLEKYGIMNTDISDYSDKKIDYILHILTTDLAGTLSPKDMTEIKNFKSLRDCLMRVKKNLDPASALHAAILKFIRENTMATFSDIAAGLATSDESSIARWAEQEDMLKKEFISKTDDGFGQIWLISNMSAPDEFTGIYSMMRNDPEKFEQLSSFQKKTQQKKIEILFSLLSQIVQQSNASSVLKSSNDKVNELSLKLDEYRAWTRQKQMRTEISSSEIQGPKPSFIERLVEFFGSLFGGGSAVKKSGPAGSSMESVSSSGTSASSRKISGASRAIYTKVKTRNQPIIALSDYIILSKENDKQVETIIRDFEENNLKIIMPVLNARKALYPVRSAKLLIPDIEYLLIDPSVVMTSESVTAYTDSLVGVKLHDDLIPGNTINLIEKYLRNIYRQKKNRLRMQTAKTQK